MSYLDLSSSGVHAILATPCKLEQTHGDKNITSHHALDAASGAVVDSAGKNELLVILGA